jgi:alginate O-acetyltransferase complex protein AlgI
MLFNSVLFLFFFALVAAVFHSTPAKWRWIVLLAASMVFYAAWDYRFLAVVFAVAVVAFGYGHYGARIGGRWTLAAAIVLILTPLAFFKYANFMLTNLAPVFDTVGATAPDPIAGLILPLGISFYTFQLLSYCLDVHAGRYQPVESFWKLVLYPMYFPHQIAGPIIRPGLLIPQFTAPQTPGYEVLASGFRLFLWGLFKKVFVADRLAVFVDAVYRDPAHYRGLGCLLALYFFAMQIYCDFSGYTDMALGVSRMLGIELCENFRRPYFAASLREFWGRWHISLSTWMRDYLYIPLGGDRVSRGRWVFNIMAVFSLSGLWHGANWTFVLWGVYHGVLLVVERGIEWLFPRGTGDWLRRGVGVVLTFHLVVLGWVLFRSPDLVTAGTILTNVGLTTMDHFWDVMEPIQLKLAGLGIAAVVIGDFTEEVGWLSKFDCLPLPIRWSTCYAAIFLVVLFPGSADIKTFIYFQF